MNQADRKADLAWRLLRWGFALAPFLAGLDKFTNLITNWSMYLSPLAERLLPVDTATFMKAVGVIEMTVGILMLTRHTRLAAYAAAAWLLLIAVNLLTTGAFYDLAVRDAELALAAFALAKLTEWRTERALSTP